MNSGSGRLATPTFTFLPMKLLGLLPFRLRWLLFRRIDPDFPIRRKERKDLNPTEAANRDWADIDLWDLYTSAWHLPLVRARTGRFSANLEFESLLTRGPSRITFGARNVEFYSQLILTNPYEVRLATSGDKEFQNRKPEWNGIFEKRGWEP